MKPQLSVMDSAENSGFPATYPAQCILKTQQAQRLRLVDVVVVRIFATPCVRTMAPIRAIWRALVKEPHCFGRVGLE
jgi:hypothetical protein